MLSATATPIASHCHPGSPTRHTLDFSTIFPTPPEPLRAIAQPPLVVPAGKDTVLSKFQPIQGSPIVPPHPPASPPQCGVPVDLRGWGRYPCKSILSGRCAGQPPRRRLWRRLGGGRREEEREGGREEEREKNSPQIPCAQKYYLATLHALPPPPSPLSPPFIPPLPPPSPPLPSLDLPSFSRGV